MKITRKSAISGIERSRDIPVNPEHYIQWADGFANIQTAMPYLNDADKDFILSGITKQEWDNAFSEYATE